jgi:ribokinase
VSSRRGRAIPPSANRSGGVVVVGSVNSDYLCSLRRLPAPGETVLGDDLAVASGGKGGNQAVAAAKVGVPTALVACVGNDPDGEAIAAALAASGVDTSGVAVLPGDRTGLAFVFVTGDGESSIVVSPGANSKLTSERTESALRKRLSREAVLVTQAEIPAEAVAAALATAGEMGSRVVLNLAPFRPMGDDLLRRCDPLVLNAGEAGALLGHVVGSPEEALAACRELRSSAPSVVITLGSRGAVVADPDTMEHVAAPAVEAVDSTGAGDAFTGVLAAGLWRGDDLVTAVRQGVAAGSYSVGRRGAQSSYPTRAELDAIAHVSDVP